MSKRIISVFCAFFLAFSLFGPVAAQTKEVVTPPHVVSNVSSTTQRKQPTAADLTRPIRRNVTLSADPSDRDLTHSGIFFEPLQPLNGRRQAGENEALAKALTAVSSS